MKAAPTKTGDAKEALDRGYERSLRLGIPWTIAEMERSLKHGTAKI